MKNQGRFEFVFFSLFTFCLMMPVTVSAMAEHIAGEYVVKLKAQSRVMGLGGGASIAAGLNAQVKNMVSNRLNTMVVQKSILIRPEAAIEDLKNNPMVEMVEPNYIYHASRLPNDSRLSDLWGLVNKKKTSGGVDIDAKDAWDITTGSRDVVVAVIDTGINYNDPDLKNNMWINEQEAKGQPGVDDDGNGYVDDVYGYDFLNNDADPIDDQNHGSHCAGTIGAEGDNGQGVVGVAWKVRLMALKFLSAQGGTLEGAIKSIDYAVENGAHIMSNSWGGGGQSQLLKEAIERAEKAGILFVAAAGNEKNNNDASPTYPANYDVPNVMSVAAIDSSGRLASFSNYGEQTVHIAAPGVNILSTGKNGLVSLSGTSMATPHVSGVAALLLSNEPNLHYSDLKDRMMNTAVPRSNLNNKVISGVLNAYHALSNTRPGIDENDPGNWDQLAQSVSTQHPYEKNSDVSFTINVPGAEKVAVHFDTFETERNYDKVYFYDGNGVEYGMMTGSHSGSFSPIVPGDTIVVRLVSDFSINRHGFDIDYVSYVGGTRDQWQSFDDPVSTNHPYRNFMDHEVVFEKPGASQIKVQFGRFDLERGYDYVIFYDGSGQELERWDGDHSGEFSPTAQGDVIVLRFQTDFSVRRYGFDVEKVFYLQ